MKHRGIRRQQLARAKSRARNKLQQMEPRQAPSAKEISRSAAVHCAWCSCAMCGNPRKYYKGKAGLTMQEIKANESTD